MSITGMIFGSDGIQCSVCRKDVRTGKIINSRAVCDSCLKELKA